MTPLAVAVVVFAAYLAVAWLGSLTPERRQTHSRNDTRHLDEIRDVGQTRSRRM